jgi:hypothetical protein
MAQTYQILGNIAAGGTVTQGIATTMASLIDNGRGCVVTRILLDGSNRLRVTLDPPLPQDEYDSYQGSILAVPG